MLQNLNKSINSFFFKVTFNGSVNGLFFQSPNTSTPRDPGEIIGERHVLLDKYSTVWDILDMDGYLDCIDEDCEITFYATGRVMSLKEFSSQIMSLMVSAQFENWR